MSKIEHCMDCGEEMNALDLEPNGDKNCTCARCLAEYSHDFIKEPNVIFTRGGRRIDDWRTTAITRLKQP